ncbi:hypothetical protein [Streptomonospora wellingtoniae]|uniref:Uncharacterized protein n=1 Tax=Streptomonospora wellingtoniae TaxID=3075544 RepID=A0ABU2L101_9ACTN|nr:hypothetical protein [Streptomonospora sp. DSM 45055]MDT0305236.1 hypothetical protein [Streptomonospora sp. DSM 45055]
MNRRRIRSFAAGVLIANSAPHIATAISGRRHLTPLAGRDSGPAANGVWAGMNLAAGALLLRGKRRPATAARWDGDLVAFEAGYLAFALWMAGSEATMRLNWDAGKAE